MARGAHGVLPDPERKNPSTDVEGQSLSGRRAREVGWGAGEAAPARSRR